MPGLEQSQFSRAEVQTLQRFKVESDSDFLYEAAQTTQETKAT